MSTKRLSAFASIALLTSALSISTQAHSGWDGGFEGGQVLQGAEKGSRLRFKLFNDERPFTQNIYADWVRGDNKSSSYELGYAPRYYFSKNTYVFGEGSFKTSNFLDIDQQAKLLGGFGIQLRDSTSQQFFAELDASRISTKYDASSAMDTSSENVTQATARIGAVQKISGLIKFELDASYSLAEELKATSVEAGLSFRVPGGAIKYSQRLRSRKLGNDEPVDVTDSSVSFNYGF